MSHHHGSTGGMSGMDMGTVDSLGVYAPMAMRIARIYWYLIVAIVGVAMLANIYSIINGRRRVRQAQFDPDSTPAMPYNRFTQAYATVQTVFREMAYPQGVYWTKRGFAWLTPPTIGRTLILFAYFITISVMLTVNAVKNDIYYYERLGYRAAWICVMQLPLVVILSAKCNIVGYLIGSSYERLNWLHRWVSRTLWVCVTFHGGIFLRSWIRAGILSYEMQYMPVVVYGMGAWGVLTWMNITGLVPIRNIAYELFVLQHLASAGVFLWLVYLHLPTDALIYFWLTIGFVAFDRVARWVWFAVRNLNVFRTRGTGLRLADRVGYRAELQAVPGNTTRITIKNVPFKWKAGQHVYLAIPRLGFFESHPFTISNTHRLDESSPFATATIAVRAHGGFSKRLYNYANKRGESGAAAEVRAFIQGPFGCYPTWNAFDTVLLISASTGCSFTLPVLEDVLASPGCVKHITFMLLVRDRPQCSCYLERLREAAVVGAASGILVRIQIVVTGNEMDDKDEYEGDIASRCVCGPDTPAEACCCGGGHDTVSGKVEGLMATTTDAEDAITPRVGGSCCSPAPQVIEASCCAGKVGNGASSDSDNEDEKSEKSSGKDTKTTTTMIEKLPPTTTLTVTGVPATTNSNANGGLTRHANHRFSHLSSLARHSTSSDSDSKSATNEKDSASATASLTTSKPYVEFSQPRARPDLAAYIRHPVEAAMGETLVVCCGGKSLTGKVRNVVASLSDERGVHKGTGALGIQLFVEEFGY